MPDEYFLKHNIHKSSQNLAHLKWIKAPYRYKMAYRLVAAFFLTISLIIISTASYLLFMAWNETPKNKYQNLVEQHLSSLVRDMVNNAPQQSNSEIKSTTVRIPLLIEALISEGFSYKEAVGFLSLYIERNHSQIPTLEELKLFINDREVNNIDSLVEKGIISGPRLILDREKEEWGKKEEWYRTRKYIPAKDSLEDKRRRAVFDELLNYYAYVRRTIPGNQVGKNWVQIEGIKHHRIVSLEIANQPSTLAEPYHLNFPFFMLLHYSQANNFSTGTLGTNPYIDSDAPFQLILSNENLEEKVFDVSRILDLQAVLKEFNVIYNVGRNTLILDDKFYSFFPYETLSPVEFSQILRSYFTKDLQVYMQQVGDWAHREPNLLIGLKIDPKRIYELDKRPIIAHDGGGWLDILNHNYNIISRAEYIVKFVPYLLLTLLAALIVFVTLLIRLCTFTGYVANRHGEIPENSLHSALFKLAYIDYLPLEVLATLLLIFFALARIYIYDLNNLILTIVVFIPLVAWLIIVFMLSTLRRYRGGVLFTYTILAFLKNLFLRIQKKWRWSIGYGSLLFLIFYFTWTNNYIGLAILVGGFFILGLSYSLDMDLTRHRIRHILGRDEKVEGRRILPRAWFLRQVDQDLDDLQQLLDSSMMSQLKSEKLKTELITNVSHDLKTPITSIVNYANLLRRMDIASEAKEYIERIYLNSVRLQTLTENLLEASRAASGTIKCECIVLDINEFMKQMCGEWVDRLSDANLFLNYRVYDSNEIFYCMSFSSEFSHENDCLSLKNLRYNDDLLRGGITYPTDDEETLKKQAALQKPALVYVDPDLMVRIFDNLIGNTLKYSISNSRIFINLRDEKDFYVLEVVNTSNQNIDMSTEQLMERFIQGDISRRSEGSGLGLSIVKSLADLMKLSFEVSMNQDQFKARLKFKKVTSAEEITE